MKGIAKFVFIVLFLSFSAMTVFCQTEKTVTPELEYGWSSVDNVFSKVEINKLVKKPMAGPIKIGYTAKDVRGVMGIPDSIDEKGYIYYYRQSPIFFDDNWKVRSWDNKYGNLNILEDTIKIIPGSHISEVFKQKGFALQITKLDNSYRLEYPYEIIFINNNWKVEAISDKQVRKINPNRDVMNLEDFLEEYRDYLRKKP
ncbi:MAG: hypothetical protein WCV43_00690 [Candidatus Caldatribacteriota bacterium]|jgi:hypothetical protein|nr:hypothetical protein [Atribacterota bacterium]MDD3031122.1 hypothetical protein [Atribacterota bacterium]MDD3640504.1 hypothetical protein [Atribacterota bacterium]MDD4288892.1 hypothetical protein [Atribacterota bacterium]MDD4764521.1 hypothetical protein [Atribacterota bacterium]